MGNCPISRKTKSQRRSLPPELLSEITKWIPLTRFEHRELRKNSYKPKKGDIICWCQLDPQKAASHPPFWKRQKKNQKPCVGPENAKLLLCNSALTAFLRQRCKAILQMIAQVNDYYNFEIVNTNEFYDYYRIIIIRRKGINNANYCLTMAEMMRLLCFGSNISFKYDPIIFAEKYGTMPKDFRPDLFIDSIISFTEKTPFAEMIYKCAIILNEEQGKIASKSLRKYQRDGEIEWRNWSQPGFRFELKLNENNSLLSFDTSYPHVIEWNLV